MRLVNQSCKCSKYPPSAEFTCVIHWVNESKKPVVLDRVNPLSGRLDLAEDLMLDEENIQWH